MAESAQRAAVTVLLTMIGSSLGSPSNISNVEPRRDTGGLEMDMHDGNIVQFSAGGVFWWYGMGYQNCTETKGLIPPVDCPGIYKKFGGCGFRTDHGVHIYSSPDLVSWTRAREALPIADRPEGIYFRPKVVRCPLTGKFVLWINYLPPASTPLAAYPHATYSAATADSPEGPFTIVTPKTAVRNTGGGDFALFVDADGSGYIAYGAWSNSHTITIEKLNPNFEDSSGIGTEALTPSGNEAPMLFVRGGLYYLLWGPTCCFCHTGSGAIVSVASHPLGPWNNTGIDINPKNGWFGSRVIAAQNNFVSLHFACTILNAVCVRCSK